MVPSAGRVACQIKHQRGNEPHVYRRAHALRVHVDHRTCAGVGRWIIFEVQLGLSQVRVPAITRRLELEDVWFRHSEVERDDAEVADLGDQLPSGGQLGGETTTGRDIIRASVGARVVERGQVDHRDGPHAPRRVDVEVGPGLVIEASHAG